MNDTAPIIPDTPVFGHETFTGALAQSVAAGRIAHGWLLTGPGGMKIDHGLHGGGMAAE